MSFIDPYIFYFFIFSPVIASILITLIPTSDLSSKVALSKFFATTGFLAFIRIFLLFLDQDLPFETSLKFILANFHITFILALNKYNIFLYGAASAILMANMALHVIHDSKSNIHQVAPFVLTFILYISFGQNDLRVALPVLSIANFLVYYLIGNTEKSRRGTTIFQMGIFLFFCDAMVLVLLQIPYSDYLSKNTVAIFDALLIVPAISRLLLPMFAPFVKRLVHNIDESEGPFLMIFLHLAGILILIMVKRDLGAANSLISLIALTTLIGAIFLALLAISDRRSSALPYYFLLFYSSLVSLIMFTTDSPEAWYCSISLFLTNIACFFHSSRCTLFGKNINNQIYSQKFRSIWYITLTLLVGIPGWGIGASLWPLLYWCMVSDNFSHENLFQGFWLFIIIGWIIGLLLLSLALVLSVRDETNYLTKNTGISLLSKLPLLQSLSLATFFVTLLSWIIPLITMYAKIKVPHD